MQQANMRLNGKKDESVTNCMFVSSSWSNAGVNRYVEIFVHDSRPYLLGAAYMLSR